MDEILKKIYSGQYARLLKDQGVQCLEFEETYRMILVGYPKRSILKNNNTYCIGKEKDGTFTIFTPHDFSHLDPIDQPDDIVFDTVKAKLSSFDDALFEILRLRVEDAIKAYKEGL